MHPSPFAIGINLGGVLEHDGMPALSVDQAELLPWKRALQQMLGWKADHPASALNQVSCEFIPFADYGGAARYSIFAQNVACAAWLRMQAEAVQLKHRP